MATRDLSIRDVIEPFLTMNNTDCTSNYNFEPSKRLVVINESDVKCVLLIVNITTGDVLYSPLGKGRTARVNKNKVFLRYDTSSMDSTDDLLIAYQKIDTNETELILKSMYSQLDNVIGDGTNTCITLVTKFGEPVLLEDSEEDKIKILISDDLSGLESFTVLGTGKTEDLPKK